MLTTIKNLNKRVLLLILDGFGYNPKSPKNAVMAAKKPNLDKLFATYPLTYIEAGGEAVGLPKGVCGNSEVGHMNIGAGRPVRQDLVRINEAIAQDTLKDMPLLKELITRAKKGSKRIHLMGLLSNGGVHSHINHIKAVIEILAKETDLEVFYHAFMDGRDTARDSGVSFVKEILKVQGFTFASMQGRAVGMDRDRRWERIEKSYNTLIGQAKIENIDPVSYIESQYKKEVFDEFIEPILFDKKNAIGSEDIVFLLNFRPDRAIEITRAFADPDFHEFNRPVKPSWYLCMTPYLQGELDLPILFDKEQLHNGLSEYLSSKGIKMFKTAETEKFAHVTYFFNGGRKEPFPNEERLLIPSPRDVATYDLKPQMSAYEVTDGLIKHLEDKSFSFYTVNYANCDMVGHTGNFDAAVKAVEAVDTCVGRLVKVCNDQDITIILTADHGNADEMAYSDGSVHTAHTCAPVPFCVIDSKIDKNSIKVSDGTFALKDIAPTTLYIMGIENPSGFTGKNIFQ